MFLAWFNIGKLFKDGFKNLLWMIETMDVTQWGIVAVIFVVVGFFALRTKI